jgi:hypothetical protein
LRYAMSGGLKLNAPLFWKYRSSDPSALDFNGIQLAR